MGDEPPMIPQGGMNTLFLIRLSFMGYYGNRELVRRARILRSNMTRAEIILWSRLRSKKINGYKFRRQQPLLDYVVDFYCDELKLIIEVDGEIHSQNEKPKYDFRRGNILKINGYHIIRISNLEIETEINSAINKIISFISENLSPSQGDHRGSNK
jgi:very-short-patch-repair endonuclease